MIFKIVGWFLFFLALMALFNSGVVRDRRFTTGYKGNKLPIPMSQRLGTAGVLVVIGITCLIAGEVSDSVVRYWPIIWRVACCVAIGVVAWIVFPNLVAGHDKWSAPKNLALGRWVTALAIAMIGSAGVILLVKPRPGVIMAAASPGSTPLQPKTSGIAEITTQAAPSTSGASQAESAKTQPPVTTEDVAHSMQAIPGYRADDTSVPAQVQNPADVPQLAGEPPSFTNGQSISQPSSQRSGCLKFAATVGSTAVLRDRGVPLLQAQQLVSASLVAETPADVSQQWMDYVAHIYSDRISAQAIERILQRNCAGAVTWPTA